MRSNSFNRVADPCSPVCGLLESREILKFLVRIYNVRNKFFLQYGAIIQKKEGKKEIDFQI